MGGGGLLIFYVANVANVANVIQVHFVGFSNSLFRAKPPAKNKPSRNYWACMTNKRQKYVVPLQQISIHASSAHVNC